MNKLFENIKLLGINAAKYNLYKNGLAAVEYKFLNLKEVFGNNIKKIVSIIIFAIISLFFISIAFTFLFLGLFFYLSSLTSLVLPAFICASVCIVITIIFIIIILLIK